MGDEDEHKLQSESESEPTENGTNSSKRKLEDDIQLAKQKAQELAAKFVIDAESKRPRLEDSSELSPPANSTPAPTFVAPFVAQPVQSYGLQGTSKKISIPNGKVGVIIGKGGETIKYLQLQSGAKIQITKDSEADPYGLTRDVDLMGTSEQVNRAEQLIKEIIAETDAGGSASNAVRGINSMQPGVEQITMKVPNNKVALLIGKGGETIKNIQSRSGARMQIVPLHLPPGDTSVERTVYINGLTEQIESAKELVNDVISGKRLANLAAPTTYNTQAVYSAPGNWGQTGQQPMLQQAQYGYAQPGTYPTPSSYYGNYPTQQAGWEQSNASTVAQATQSTGYDYYGQQAQTGSALSNPGYGYSQTPPIPSYNYDQNSQQSLNYGQTMSSQAPPLDQQNQYVNPGYGPSAASSQADGRISAQPTQSSSAYLPPYSQPLTNPQGGYWAPPSYPGQPPAQAGYDQTGYSQSRYGGQQPATVPPVSQPVYGQGGYPPQVAPAPANYAQGTNPPAYAQPPPTNGFSQPPVYGAEKTADGNSGPAYGSAPVAQEPVNSQS